MIERPDHIELGTFADGEPAVLGRAERLRHTWILGKSGAGKSNLLLNMMLADLDRGAGFALLDPHSDLAMKVADSVPPSETGRVIYVDPSDLDHPIAFNPLHDVAPDRRPLVAAQVVAAFAHIWGLGVESAPRLTYILMHCLRLLLDAPGSTLLGLPRLLTDQYYRNRLTAHCRDPVVRAFWLQEFAQYTDRYAIEAVGPLQNKIGALLAPHAIRHVLGQPRSTIDIRQVMDRGQVLILNLAKARLGEGPAHLLGALLVTAIAQAAEARTDTPEDRRRDFTLFADEFQSFATESFATILSEARKWHLSVVLAHQFASQLPDRLRQAVVGNASTVLAFRIGAEDAALIADELGIASKSALVDCPNFSCWSKLLRDGMPSEPRLIVTRMAQPRHCGRFDAVRNRSRARTTRPRSVVEARLDRFFSAGGNLNRGRQ